MTQTPTAGPATATATAEALRETLAEALRETLADAVDLLRTLPRRRDQVPQARELVRRWAAGRDAVPTLVVDAHPGHADVDYDLLLDHPDGGTVAVSVQPDDGVPWSIDHATHWAAGLVLTIDGEHSVSVPEALFVLRSAAVRDPSVLEQLINHRLLVAEAASDREPVTPAERQRAADGFRRGQGLHSRTATLAWLQELGMSREVFDEHVETLARIGRVRDQLMAELGPAYLAAHRDHFAVLHGVWVRCADRAPAERIAQVAPEDLLGFAGELLSQGERIQVNAATGFVGEFPATLGGAPTGQIVGPVLAEGRFLVGAVLRRTPAEEDPELTRVAGRAAGRAAFEEWLRDRRIAADIRWHWV